MEQWCSDCKGSEFYLEPSSSMSRSLAIDLLYLSEDRDPTSHHIVSSALEFALFSWAAAFDK
jgi:hypothetical protein